MGKPLHLRPDDGRQPTAGLDDAAFQILDVYGASAATFNVHAQSCDLRYIGRVLSQADKLARCDRCASSCLDRTAVDEVDCRTGGRSAQDFVIASLYSEDKARAAPVLTKDAAAVVERDRLAFIGLGFHVEGGHAAKQRRFALIDGQLGTSHSAAIVKARHSVGDVDLGRAFDCAGVGKSKVLGGDVQHIIVARAIILQQTGADEQCLTAFPRRG